MQIISEMLNYHFILRAVIAGTLVSLCCSLLGVSLVLKRFSMIGDGLSHVGFGAIAAAAALNLAPLYVAIPVCVAAAFFLLRISQNTRINGDAAIAMISSGALAVGVMLISVSTGMNTDVYNYMFGSILALSDGDAKFSIVLSICVTAFFILFYPRLFAVTFDETFAKATGTNTGLCSTVLAVLTAVTVVLGMKMVGALLISSLIIFPPLSAMRCFKTFKSVTVCSAVLSVASFIAGMVLSMLLETPSGASVVCVNVIVFVIFAVAGKITGRAS
ncbi:MAG: metal ABC transporter permease [Anaerovoracaceae bacterium]